MKCPNCGAEFDDSLTVCPYCGAENLSAALRQQDEEIEQFHAMAEDVSHLKERSASKAAEKTNKTLLTVLCFIAAALVIFLAATTIHSIRGLGKQKTQLAQCENYYTAGDYTALSSYLEKNVSNYSGGTFEKYRRAAAFADNYDIDRQLVEDYLTDIDSKFCTPGELSGELLYLFETMALIQSYEEEGFKYGEAEAVLYYKKLYEELLHDLQLTDEEVTEYTDDYTEEKTAADYEALAGVLIDRMKSTF